MNLLEPNLQQSWPQPTNPKPVVMIGAGGIVRDAHLPTYLKAGFHVRGIFDTNGERSKSLAED